MATTRIKSYPWLIIVPLVLVAAQPVPAAIGPPSTPPAEERTTDSLLAIAGEGFHIRETRHFIIAYDTPDEALGQLIGSLEDTYDDVRRFCAASGLDVQPSSSRLNVVLFDHHDDFRRYAATVGFTMESITGFYDHEAGVVAFRSMTNSPELQRVNHRIDQVRAELSRVASNGPAGEGHDRHTHDLEQTLSALEAGREELVERFNRLVVRHEAAHQVLFELGVHVRGAGNPTWLVEGLACQFEVSQGDAAAQLGRINQMRLADLRDALQVPPDANCVSDDDYLKALNSKRLVPWADLISDSDIFTHHDGNLAYRYAQAWGLTYFLQHRHNEKLRGYLRGLHARRPGEEIPGHRELELFQTVFGVPDAAFQRDWIEFMLKLRFDPLEKG